jgi:hypothetical protein
MDPGMNDLTRGMIARDVIKDRIIVEVLILFPAWKIFSISKSGTSSNKIMDEMPAML